MAALHLDNRSAKAYLCYQGESAFMFLFRLACHILNLANMPGINLLTAYLPTYLNMETITGKVGSREAMSSSHSPGSMSIFGVIRGGFLTFSYTNQCQHYYTF